MCVMFGHTPESNIGAVFPVTSKPTSPRSGAKEVLDTPPMKRRPGCGAPEQTI